VPGFGVGSEQKGETCSYSLQPSEGDLSLVQRADPDGSLTKAHCSRQELLEV
jgi:hypothetical protein